MDWIAGLFRRGANSLVEVVSLVWNLTVGLWGSIRDLADYVGRGLWDLFNWVTNFGWRSYHGVLGLEDWAGRAWHDLTHSIAETGRMILQRAIDIAWGWINDLVGYVNGGLDSVRRLVTGVYSWAIDNIFNPLAAQVVGVTSTMYTLWNDLRAFVDRTGEWAANYARDLLFSTIKPLWDLYIALRDEWIPLLRGVKDFLVFVVEHPLNWWYILIRQVLERAQRNASEWIMASLVRNAPMVEDVIVRWLGR